MNKPINIFIDNCVFYHSLEDPNELPKGQEWLRQEMLSIKEIIQLNKKGELKAEHDLNIMIEKNQGGKAKEIEKLWGDLILSPTFFEFQGAMSNPEEVEEDFKKPMRERKEIIKDILKNDKLDFTHLVHAEFYRVKYFVTTDKRLINQINNSKCRDILKVKVVSPSDFLKEFEMLYPKLKQGESELSK